MGWRGSKGKERFAHEKFQNVLEKFCSFVWWKIKVKQKIEKMIFLGRFCNFLKLIFFKKKNFPIIKSTSKKFFNSLQSVSIVYVCTMYVESKQNKKNITIKDFFSCLQQAMSGGEVIRWERFSQELYEKAIFPCWMR